jgi:hypothetical protein
MAWSYNEDLPRNLDVVRFNVGDTDAEDQLLQDGEIEYLLSDSGDNVLLASARAADRIAAKFARQAAIELGDFAEEAQQKAQAYEALADTLRMESSSGSGVGSAPIPRAGGITTDSKDAVEEDTGIVQPRFKRDMFDN